MCGHHPWWFSLSHIWLTILLWHWAVYVQWFLFGGGAGSEYIGGWKKCMAYNLCPYKGFEEYLSSQVHWGDQSWMSYEKTAQIPQAVKPPLAQGSSGPRSGAGPLASDLSPSSGSHTSWLDCALPSNKDKWGEIQRRPTGMIMGVEVMAEEERFWNLKMDGQATSLHMQTLSSVIKQYNASELGQAHDSRQPALQVL